MGSQTVIHDWATKLSLSFTELSDLPEWDIRKNSQCGCLDSCLECWWWRLNLLPDGPTTGIKLWFLSYDKESKFTNEALFSTRDEHIVRCSRGDSYSSLGCSLHTGPIRLSTCFPYATLEWKWRKYSVEFLFARHQIKSSHVNPVFTAPSPGTLWPSRVLILLQLIPI